jgi:hypothetical protein
MQVSALRRTFVHIYTRIYLLGNNFISMYNVFRFFNNNYIKYDNNYLNINNQFEILKVFQNRQYILFALNNK